MAVRTKVGVAVASALLAGALGGCDDTAQFAPSLPIVAGFRVDDSGGLAMWTGQPCEQVTQIWYRFSGDDESVRAILETETPLTVERLVVGSDVPGFAPREALPSSLDWHDYTALTVGFETADGPRPVETDLAALAEQGDQPAGTYYVDGFGWLDEQEIRDRDREDFLNVCTDDPGGP